MRVVAVVNQKGGVGKTTTAINLGAALGAFEKRVLLVDCDPQGNASRGLAVKATPPLLYEVLRGEATLADCVRPTGFPGLDIVPSNRDLVGVEVEFVGQPGWEHRLREAIEPIDRLRPGPPRLPALARTSDHLLARRPPMVSLSPCSVSTLRSKAWAS